MYYLEKDSNMTFDLNYDVEPYIKALFPYTDKDGHQYISFQNGFKNQIVFYDIQTKEMAFKIDLDIEGDNGVGFFLGYYIDSLDSIYLTSLHSLYLDQSLQIQGWDISIDYTPTIQKDYY